MILQTILEGLGLGTLLVLVCACLLYTSKFYESKEMLFFAVLENVHSCLLYTSGKIAFVFQNPKLLKTTLEENIRGGCKNASREDILRAARLAQCDDILAKLPEGIDSIVGGKGVYLSGGEVQRVAIARAILKEDVYKRQFLTRTEFFDSLVSSYGQEYVDTLMSYTPGWMFPVLFVVTFLGGILGALLGKAVLKKHFEKAGIV